MHIVRNTATGSLLAKFTFILLSCLFIISGISTVMAQSVAKNKPSLDLTMNGTSARDEGRGKVANGGVYIVLLDEDAVAHYAGDLANLAATSARATGKTKLDTKSAAARAYVTYLRTRQDDVLNKLNSQLRTSTKPVYRYFYATNGFALRMTPAQADAARQLAGVRTVERDVAQFPDTDRGPTLIGAPAIWNGTATGVSAEGEGMIVGLIDSGINQGHPSFAEIGADGYGGGGEYAATNPYGAGNFAGGAKDDCVKPEFTGLCNNKLIGSYAFLDTNGGDDVTPAGDPLSKDTDGHGSHVASTAAGNHLTNPPLLDADGNDSGVSLGNISGVAPHAHIIAYKVCAPSCFPSDIAAAIDQAIIDGTDVLNHSIGAAAGSPWADSKSLAFKGARAAGIMLHNSAGNAGPGAATAATINSSPWVTSTAASTHDRSFPPKFLQDMSGGATPAPANMNGRSVSESFTGIIVWAGAFPVGLPGDANFDQPEQCLEAFPAGTFTSDQIVVCDRGAIARVQKARNVRDGGAGAMVLANIQGGATSTNDDVHVIPAIHINAGDGDELRTWLADGTGHTGTITATGPVLSDPSVADALAGFSSRGPYTGFDWLAPHITAPGSAIYAAGADLQFVHPGLGTADPNDDPSVQGAYGIISGTSMASPHGTGSAALLKQLRPDLNATQISSILMTTGVTDMRKEDNSTPADVFDFGGGRVSLADAARAGLALDETIANYDAADPDLGGDPSTLNHASLVSTTCVLNCSWQRTVTNVSGNTVNYGATGVGGDGFVINVSPASFTLNDGESQLLSIDADTSLADAGWNFGEVVLTPGGSTNRGAGFNLSTQHIAVAALFTTSTNAALFSKHVSDDTASVGQTLSYQLNLTNVSETGTYTVTDTLPANATLVAGSENAVINGGTEITPFGPGAGNTLVWEGTLDTGSIDVVSDPFPPAGSPFGYVDVPSFGVSPQGCSSVCDDTNVELTGLPPFTYAGTTYTSMFISSNGFIVPGEDNTGASTPSNQSLPSASAPNNVIAPFWTDLDLDGTSANDPGAGNIYAAVFNSGTVIIVEWNNVELFGVPDEFYTIQIQIATDAHSNPGIWFVYNALPTIPASLTVGAESAAGLFGDNHYFNGSGTAPITGDLGDLRVDSVSGGHVSLTFDMVVSGNVGDSVSNVADVSSASVNETSIAVSEIIFLDSDGDGVEDFEDNCSLVANASQCDSDGDGFGNHCDADFNNSGFVNFGDLGLLRVGFNEDSVAPDYHELDLNCDANINFGDLAVFKTLFGAAPGPGANE